MNFRERLWRIPDIIEKGDLTLTSLLLGICIVGWTTIAIITGDIYKFAGDWVFYAPWFWVFNGYFTGWMFITCATQKFPPMLTLFSGSWSVMVYMWVATTRPVSSASSGITLNFIIIFVGLLLVHRAGRK